MREKIWGGGAAHFTHWSGLVRPECTLWHAAETARLAEVYNAPSICIICVTML